MIYIVVYAGMVDTVGMRELRQNPAPVLRAVEAGNEVTISVNGRPVHASCRWRTRRGSMASAPRGFTLPPWTRSGNPNCEAPEKKTRLTTPGRRRALVDTSVLVATDADLSGLACQISAVSYAELHFGVHGARDDETRLARQHRLTLIQATYGHGIAFTDETAHHYGLLCGRLNSKAAARGEERWT